MHHQDTMIHQDLNQNHSLLTLENHTLFLNKLLGTIPSFHVVLGSGFGKALSPDEKIWIKKNEFPFSSIPHLSKSTVVDHAGVFYLYEHLPTHQTVLFQAGRLHGYEGHSPQTAILPIMLTRSVGCKNFILTNAAGGLHPNFKPGDVMLIQDHINFTGKNPLLGENPTDIKGNAWGPRFPDMSQIYDRSESLILKQTLASEGLRTQEGIYLGVLGPSFETPAEIQLFSKWGVSAVGMSTVWEAIAIHHSQAKVIGMSLISNLAAGLVQHKLEHEVIVETCRQSALQIVNGIVKYIEKSFLHSSDYCKL